MPELVRRDISITGTVQGVGFRPHVYNLARSLGLRGSVRNSGRGVYIQVEGPADRVEAFITALREAPPVLARIDEMRVAAGSPQGWKDFTITNTEGIATGESVVPPDTALCPRCRREIADPRDRHYRYPFTNCTNCGPRFTIVKRLPYDRQFTSMAGFAMCPACAREYRDPGDRRFHAQPVACPDCGPRAWLVDAAGATVNGDWLAVTVHLLAAGSIIAIKSLGGFHLSCDAHNRAALRALRTRKGRYAKPLAVMCRDLDTVREHCHVNDVEAELLASPAAPVVVLDKKQTSTLPAELAPGLHSLGVMLPYTPLHALLLATGPPVLVMTSGNKSGLPLARENHQALDELAGIADYFLLHDRDIVNRCDDSVVRVVMGETQFLRRSRGYVPSPVPVPKPGQFPGGGVYLGAGGDMKNTFCLLKGGLAYMGQHTGSLDTRQGMDNYRESLEKFQQLLQARPGLVACDPHPGYHVSRLARELAPREMKVWHHHAHMAACMAENGLREAVTGIILDGTGYGRDGNLWGFEVLHGDFLDFTRELHLEYLPLPGGDRAVRNPWISAVAWLVTRMGEQGRYRAAELFPGREKEIELLVKMIRQEINSPRASSCGRLFDAVSAMLGICTTSTYDGQAAIELGELAPAVFTGPGEIYPFTVEGSVIRTGGLLESLLGDLDRGLPVVVVVRKFHDTVMAMVVDSAELVGKKHGTRRVVLSGGSWHNRYLLQGAVARLQKRGFAVYYHRLVPPGDGGLALGQAVVAMYRDRCMFGNR